MTVNKHSGTSLLRLRVYPHARRNEIIDLTDGVLQVKVAAPPVKGKANRELTAFLSRALDVSQSSLTIIKGHTSRNKVVAVAGLSREEIVRRLTAWMSKE